MNLDLVDSELIPYIESIPSSAHIDWSNIDLVRQQSREKREQLAESLPKIDNVISTDYFVDIENERIQVKSEFDIKNAQYAELLSQVQEEEGVKETATEIVE